MVAPQSKPRRQSKPAVRQTAASRRQQVTRRIAKHHQDERFQHELKEMQETKDLRDIDDDVEAVATLFEWYAPEHTHRPKSAMWFIVLAAVTSILVIIFAFLLNFIGALTTALVGGLLYYLAQSEPRQMRYRIMVDGVAVGNTLYHFRDLSSFNVIYEPDETQTVLLRSKHRFAPLLHMELGDTDPVAVRDILLEFVPEDQDLEEPLIDILARRVGF